MPAQLAPDAGAVLRELGERGIRVEAEGGALRVTPRSLLTDADRTALREHKPALLQLLAGEQRPPRPEEEESATGAPFRCPRCLRVLPLGQITCAGGCEARAVSSVAAFPEPGPVAPQGPPAGVEYEPGQDWPPASPRERGLFGGTL